MECEPLDGDVYDGAHPGCAFNPFVVRAVVDGKTVYRMNVGRYFTREGAAAARKILAERGVEAFVRKLDS